MKIPFFRKKEEALMDMNTAEQMLSHVFSACEREQNTVSLETLISYSNYRKERYAIQRSVIIVVLALFMLLPLLFFAADIRVDLSASGSVNPVYTVSVDTKIPIRQIQARMDGRSVPIYEISPDRFMIQPRENGVVDIAVTLVNRQYTASSLSVSDVDCDAPALVSTAAEESCIRLYLSDEGSGVDYAGITVTDASGDSVSPIGWDAEAGCVLLDYPRSPLNLRIPDLRGNVLQVTLKPQA